MLMVAECTTGGSAYCWGDNELGRIGNGRTEQVNVPVRVLGQP